MSPESGAESPAALVAEEINDDPEDHPLRTERYVWLKFFERFRFSIEAGAVVTFG